jgi:hypothetical protein
MQTNRLSYSQLRLYSECGKKYQYYYKDRLRETVKSGALFFGTAFDKAIESVLKDPLCDEKKVFDEIFTHQDINGKRIYIPDSLSVVYAISDFDGDILCAEDVSFLDAKAKELLPQYHLENIWEIYATCLSHKKQRAFKHWPENEQKYYNLCCWFSLRRKGHLMLEANRTRVLPRFKQILSTQKQIDLLNDKGDTLVGFVDCIAIWEDGRKIIFDYKTSSIEYEKDSVVISPQLSIYSEAEAIDTCGYIVFRKGILKNKVKICSKCGHDGSGARHKTCANEISKIRCNGAWKETITPEVDIQIIIADIPARTKAAVLENLHQTNEAIHQGIFVRNLNSCVQPWGKCPYYNKCFGDGSDAGLEKVEESKK